MVLTPSLCFMLLLQPIVKKDMPGQMRKMAEFLEIEIDESKWDTIVEHCTFDWMKSVSHFQMLLLLLLFCGGKNLAQDIKLSLST